MNETWPPVKAQGSQGPAFSISAGREHRCGSVVPVFGGVFAFSWWLKLTPHNTLIPNTFQAALTGLARQRCGGRHPLAPNAAPEKSGPSLIMPIRTPFCILVFICLSIGVRESRATLRREAQPSSEATSAPPVWPIRIGYFSAPTTANWCKHHRYVEKVSGQSIEWVPVHDLARAQEFTCLHGA